MCIQCRVWIGCSDLNVQYLSMKQYCLWVTLLATLAAVARSAPPETAVPTHNVFAVNYGIQRQELYTGQQFSQPLDDLHFEYGSQVFERAEPLESNILDDFQGQSIRNTPMYSASSRCWLQPTQVTFDRLAESQYLQDGIDAYLFDKNYGIYVLSGTQLFFYIVGVVGSDMSMIKYAHYSIKEVLNSADAEFVSLAGNNYLTDGTSLYKIWLNTAESDGTALLQLTLVEGFEPLKSYEAFVKVVEVNITNFLVMSNNKVILYALEDSVKVTRLPYLVPAELNRQVKELVDVVNENGNIYLLEATLGVAVLPVDALDTYELVELKYGRNIKLEVRNRTIEVICEYHKNVFVAEIVVRGGRYIFNRFYNQIPDFKDIDFFNDKALFIGQHEVLILSHSINRNALLNLREQYMKTYPSQGINSFEVMKPYSNDTTAVLIGISDDEAIVVRIHQTPPYLHCDFNGVSSGIHTFVVEIQSAYCGTLTYEEWETKFNTTDAICLIRYPMVFRLNTPYQEKSRNIISISSVALWLVLVLFLLGLAAKWGTKMNSALRQLRDEILKKRGSHQSRGTLGSNVNMLRNAI